MTFRNHATALKDPVVKRGLEAVNSFSAFTSASSFKESASVSDSTYRLNVYSYNRKRMRLVSYACNFWLN